MAGILYYSELSLIGVLHLRPFEIRSPEDFVVRLTGDDFTGGEISLEIGMPEAAASLWRVCIR